jgi:hypothetical protein
MSAGTDFRDRDREATRAADHCSEHLFESQRGAMPWKPGVIAIFGNDGYSVDGRARDEVAMLRRKLAEAGHAVLGFGVDSQDGFTWALLVSSAGPESSETGQAFRYALLADDLDDLVLEAWAESNGLD